MKFGEYAKTFIPQINEAIKLLFQEKLKTVKNDFLVSYYTELRDYILSGGKRIRPLLSIGAFNSLNEDHNDKIINPSVGIELLHNASLIHDDIIDKDNFRRGEPSFHYRFQTYHQKHNLEKMQKVDFGNSIGIIGGDSMYFLGLEAYLSNNFADPLNLKAINYYHQAFIEIADGVLIETEMVNRNKVSLKEYIEMISLKTGALIEKALLIGASYANIDEKYKTYFSTYGINLGIIFQIVDDILGTFGDSKITGKPTDGDIREGKWTCLLIEALNNLEMDDRILLNSLIKKTNITNSDVSKVKKLFLKADVINSCKKQANKYYEEASDALKELSVVIKSSELEFFTDLLDFVTKREY
jgi:geranylgeranyl diphosphate synthase, type I